MALEYFDWEVGDVFVLHLQGPITLGQATQTLRQLIHDTVAAGTNQDRAEHGRGLLHRQQRPGRIGGGLHPAQRQGAKLKLMKLAPRVQDVMQLTKLYQVIDVFPDEDSAVRSFAADDELQPMTQAASQSHRP